MPCISIVASSVLCHSFEHPIWIDSRRLAQPVEPRNFFGRHFPVGRLEIVCELLFVFYSDYY